MTATTTLTDLVDALAGVEPGSRLDEVRRAKPVQREHTQRAYEALFEGAAPAPTADERHAVAAFVAGLHGDTALTRHHAERVVDDALRAAVLLEARSTAVPGPYGAYREPGLAAESTDGPRYAVAPAVRDELGARLAAALEHAHLLVLRPREARAEHLAALGAAGWSTDEIVTLSQLVAFETYLIRLTHGLRTLKLSASNGATR